MTLLGMTIETLPTDVEPALRDRLFQASTRIDYVLYGTFYNRRDEMAFGSMVCSKLEKGLFADSLFAPAHGHG